MDGLVLTEREQSIPLEETKRFSSETPTLFLSLSLSIISMTLEIISLRGRNAVRCMMILQSAVYGYIHNRATRA